MSFSFPELKPEDLVESFDAINLRIRDISVIQRPTAEGVKPLFEFFLTEVAEIPRDELYPTITNCSSGICFKNPEEHAESTQTRAFFNCLCSLMSLVGVRDFGWKDLAKPESARLVRHLSALANFALYKQDLVEEFEEFEKQSAAETEAHRAAEREGEKLEEEREAARRDRETDQLEVVQIQVDILELEENVTREEAQLKNRQSQVKKQYDMYEKQDKELQAALQDLQKAEKERDYWRSKVLPDTEDLRVELARLQQETQLINAELAKTKVEVEQKVQESAQLQELLKEVQKCGRAELEAVGEAVHRKQSVNAQYKQLNKLLLERSEKIEDCIAHQAGLEQRIEETRERVAIFKEKAKAKIKDLDDCLAAVSRQSAERDPSLKAPAEQVEKLLQQVAALGQQYQECNAAYDKELEERTEELAEFQHNTLNHARQLKKLALEIMAKIPQDRLATPGPVSTRPGSIGPVWTGGPLSNVTNTPRQRSTIKATKSAGGNKRDRV